MSGTKTPSASVSSTVSLPQHLREPLQAAQPHLPPELASTVDEHLKGDSIPHAVLHDVSRWAREHAKSAGLDPNDYTMLALLAGTRTTPNANFVDTSPQKARKSDRRAITALVNAVFSVAGAGTAGWWAARSSGWKNELVRASSILAWVVTDGQGQCVLMGLLVALIVAVAETILFIIWQKRKDAKPRTRHIVRRVLADIPEEVTPDAPTAVTPSAHDENKDAALRQRKAVDISKNGSSG